MFFFIFKQFFGYPKPTHTYYFIHNKQIRFIFYQTKEKAPIICSASVHKKNGQKIVADINVLDCVLLKLFDHTDTFLCLLNCRRLFGNIQQQCGNKSNNLRHSNISHALV